MTINEFVGQVDELATKEFGISYTEGSGIDNAISNAFYGGESAEEFVSWWAQKYELTSIQDFKSFT